jgi:diguanylate cyclase (GGDEF)-like protein
MLDAASLPSSLLDVPTLSFVAVCITMLLGLFLIFAWLQQPEAHALVWWGSAYLLGASSMILWSAPAPFFAMPRMLPAALAFVGCGLIWNGVRRFHGRRLLPAGIYAGALVWLVLNQIPRFANGTIAHMALGATIMACYTTAVALEFWRERRQSLYSRSGAIMVTALHAGIFLLPLTLRVFLPHVFFADWLTLFSLDTIIYAVGAAFIMLLMVKDHHVHVYRKQATTDHLTGLCNRGAFMDAAFKMQAHQGKRGEPVTMLMFDLDHFKSVNDRFGHGVGDSVLRLFAQSLRKSMRTSDIIGRLGGEEFAAMIAGPMETIPRIAERIRANFEAAGAVVDTDAVGATVSIGAATSYTANPDIDALLLRADAALYRAKSDGRNRFHAADEELGSEQARMIATARRMQALKGRGLRKLAGPRPKHAVSTVSGEGATPPLLSPR